jgi:Spy/CpxP family protein refolding chaperone
MRFAAILATAAAVTASLAQQPPPAHQKAGGRGQPPPVMPTEEEKRHIRAKVEELARRSAWAEKPLSPPRISSPWSIQSAESHTLCYG